MGLLVNGEFFNKAKQIYKFTDPQGHETTQAWFIDANTWFDPQTASVIAWNEKGGYPRSLKASTDKRGLTTYYLYDGRGNAEEIGLRGDDLTGDDKKQIAKKFTYNAQNLCIAEETLDRKTTTAYDAVFPYLPRRMEKFCGNTLVSYVDLEYNGCGQIGKEDHSGAVAIREYDSRGFPVKKIQRAGTDDPDVITLYEYNHQGQCIQTITADSIRQDDFDIMGNCLRSRVLSHTGKLLSAAHAQYNLNNQPIWKQGANSENTLYLDYHACGLLNASRRALMKGATAYTLYAYDTRANLIEEVDPRGYCTTRTYDALCRLESETKDGLSTLFSYEAGGLLATTISPSGAATQRFYTTTGLLKEEVYPDGTANSTVYDFLGRPKRQTLNGIVWEITYDDPNRRITRTHAETKDSEIQEFDACGNLVRFTDAAGHTVEKTYDGLNRLKTEISPNGQKTVWSYRQGRVVCAFPSGEQTVSLYAGGRLLESETLNARGERIEHAVYDYDPEAETQAILRGQETTLIQMDALGHPVCVQKGNTAAFHEYDACENRTVSTDGEGNTTLQTFDPLGRLTAKQLPDGSLIQYAYDSDSNLVSCSFPNGVSWEAAYDPMGRKLSEELQTKEASTQRWEYTYKNGWLEQAKDPLGRIHAYQYDSHGRLVQEEVDGWRRTYAYDPRGLLRSAQQTRPNQSWLTGWLYSSTQEDSKVERSYDSDGRLTLEAIFLNSELLQHTVQEWSPSVRTLRIGDHTRTLSYENGRLASVSTPDLQLAYAYHYNGALKSRASPLHAAAIEVNAAGAPRNITTFLPGGDRRESLCWDAAGRLSAYAAPGVQKQFSYTSRGQLQCTGEEEYEYDFGSKGTGVRTSASHTQAQILDPFGRVIEELTSGGLLQTVYNPLGEVSSHGRTGYEWDPWGRLIQVSDSSSTWEASYDALGRRLQTRYALGWSSTLTTTSFYDPEEEFQEIGIQYSGKTFWKLYGPDACDAVIDETGECAVLCYDALRRLSEVITSRGSYPRGQHLSTYGPQETPMHPAPDLVSYALSLVWHSKAQDPTGLIWMGTRTYDPQAGRFLSADPVGHPFCLDLYAYADGDPVNNHDPDGRCFSSVYQSVGSALSYKPALNGQTPIAGYPGMSFSPYEQINPPKEPSGIYETATGQESNNFRFFFANGMDNTLADAQSSALLLSKYAQGYNVDIAYNATHGTIGDVREYRLGCNNVLTEPSMLLRHAVLEEHRINPSRQMFITASSQGVLNTKLMLQTVPREVQQKITVLAIAPAAFIEKELCQNVRHLMSKGDPIPRITGVRAAAIQAGTAQLLDAHPGGWAKNHALACPIYEDPATQYMQEFIKKYGGQ